MSGWIKLHRSLLDWEWYSDNNVFRVFSHILLKANFEDRNWQGQVIKRGSYVTSFQNLSKETKLSVQEVRTALAKLKSTQEITSQATNGYTLITIIKYNDYQDDDSDSNTPNNTQDNNPATNEQQTDNKRTTTTKELKNIRIKEDKNNISSLRSDIFQENSEAEKTKKFSKPSIEEIQTYCLERNNNVIPDKFFNFYESKGWKVGNSPMKDWKAAVRTWEKTSNTSAPISSNTQPQQSNPCSKKTEQQSSDESIWDIYDRLGIAYTKPEGEK